MADDIYTTSVLPLSSVQAGAKIQSSDVHVLNGSQRKRRSEVAVAIDRQGLYIYNVRQPKLVSSYAVSPQTIFTCPARTFYHRPLSRKVTYCAVLAPKPRLVRFSEPSSSRTGSLPQNDATTIDLDSNSSSIIHLDLIPGLKDGSGASTSKDSVLAIHEDGTVSFFSSDLDQELGTYKAFPARRQVQLGLLTNVRQARGGLLKNREDVLAAISLSSNDEETSLLVLLGHESSTAPSKAVAEITLHTIDLNTIQRQKSSTSESPPTALREVLNLSIPQSTRSEPNSTFSLHIASASLFQLTRNSLLHYDLSLRNLDITHEVRINDHELISFMRVSSQSVLVNSSTSIFMIDLPYCSIRAEYPSKALNPGTPEEASSQLASRLRMLSFLGPTKTLVALNDESILVLQLKDTTNFTNNQSDKDTNTLAQAIGRGAQYRTETSLLHAQHSRVKTSLNKSQERDEQATWTQSRPRLLALRKEADSGAFVSLMLKELNGAASARRVFSRNKVNFLLGLVFTVSDAQNVETQGHQRREVFIQYLPAEILDWLVNNNFLNPGSVETALKDQGLLRKTESLYPGSIVKAIGHWDLTLCSLRLLLGNPSTLGLEEIIFIIPLILEQRTRDETVRSQRLITSNGSETGKQIAMPSNQSSEQASIAQHRLTLHPFIKYLQQFSSRAVTKALRTHVQRHDLASLIDVLRIEIATTGWLAPYQIPQPLSVGLHTDLLGRGQSLQPVLHLLNSVLDAIGPAAFILDSELISAGTPSDSSQNAESTLTYMRAEVSAALEGVEEAVYLSGLLDEFLLCARDSLEPAHRSAHVPAPTPSPSKQDKKGLTASTKREASKLPFRTPSPRPSQGQIVTIDPGTGTGNQMSSTSEVLETALPLGLKLEDKVPVTRVGAGGEVRKRSMRDIGRLKSHKVAKYSYERILV